MAYEVEEWDFSEQPEKLAGLQRIMIGRKLLVVIDRKPDTSVVMVGREPFREIDRAEAQAIKEALNALHAGSASQPAASAG